VFTANWLCHLIAFHFGAKNNFFKKIIFTKIYNKHYQAYKMDFFKKKLDFFLKKSKTNAPYTTSS
jgi:hypothetical protein